MILYMLKGKEDIISKKICNDPIDTSPFKKGQQLQGLAVVTAVLAFSKI